MSRCCGYLEVGGVCVDVDCPSRAYDPTVHYKGDGRCGICCATALDVLYCPDCETAEPYDVLGRGRREEGVRCGRLIIEEEDEEDEDDAPIRMSKITRRELQIIEG